MYFFKWQICYPYTCFPLIEFFSSAVVQKVCNLIVKVCLFWSMPIFLNDLGLFSKISVYRPQWLENGTTNQMNHTEKKDIIVPRFGQIMNFAFTRFVTKTNNKIYSSRWLSIWRPVKLVLFPSRLQSFWSYSSNLSSFPSLYGIKTIV